MIRLEARVITDNNIVGWSDSALTHMLTNKEEIVPKKAYAVNTILVQSALYTVRSI
jgi:hypothetical protein